MRCICPNCNTEFETAALKTSEKIRIAYAIRDAIVDYFLVSIEEMASTTRAAEVVEARHVAMFLIYKHAKLSGNETGELFGGRHYATIWHARKRCENALRNKLDVFQHLQCMYARIENIVKNKPLKLAA